MKWQRLRLDNSSLTFVLYFIVSAIGVSVHASTDLPSTVSPELQGAPCLLRKQFQKLWDFRIDKPRMRKAKKEIRNDVASINEVIRSLRDLSSEQRFAIELEAAGLSLKDLQGKSRVEIEALLQQFLHREQENILITDAIKRFLVERVEKRLPPDNLNDEEFVAYTASMLKKRYDPQESMADIAALSSRLRPLFEQEAARVLGFDPFHDQELFQLFRKNEASGTEALIQKLILAETPTPPVRAVFWKKRIEDIRALEERIYAFLVAEGDISPEVAETRAKAFEDRYFALAERIVGQKLEEDPAPNNNLGVADINFWFPSTSSSVKTSRGLRKPKHKTTEDAEPTTVPLPEPNTQVRKLRMLKRARDTIQSWDPELRKKIGYLLFKVQRGEKMSADTVKSLVKKGLFAVKELRVQFTNGTHWRVVYTDTEGTDIAVLHAFQKTSKQTHPSDYDAIIKASALYKSSPEAAR